MSEPKWIADGIDALKQALIDYGSVAISKKPPWRMLAWFTEVLKKNTRIYQSKNSAKLQDQETFPKSKACVYWIDLGMTIGSEFHDFHFATVISEQKYTALIVPLTTKKNRPPAWTEDTDLIVDIGVVMGFPDECKDCLAYVGGMQSVSKKRLDTYRDGNKARYNISLSPQQFGLIQDNIRENICKKDIDIQVAS